MKENDNITINSQSPQLWDNVAETYSDTANTSEIKLGQEIEQLLLGLGIEPGSSLLEVGSGSGHLSGYLAGRGFQTTLIDFSKVALEKAKKHYEQNNITGNFINADMFDLSADLVEPHDVVWNSGVLEHFNAWEVIEVLKKMKQVTRKYVLVLVPNAMSVPYLLFRQHAMEKGDWIWGRELLRDSMKHLAEAAGLEVIEEQYIGRHFTYDLFDYVNSKLGAKYRDIDQQLIPQEQNYLIALIARPKNKDTPSNYEKIIENVLRKESKIENDTYYFDFSSLNSYLENKNTEVNELSQKINELQNATDDFISRLEEKDNKVHELQNVAADFMSQLEEKDNKIHELQNATDDFISQLEEKDNKIHKLQSVAFDLTSKLGEKDNKIKELQNLSSDFKSQLEDKTNEILDLKETLNQRESSLSWRFSQYYGKYFSVNSPITKIVTPLLNWIVGPNKSESYSNNNAEEENLYKLEFNNILEEHKGKIKGIIIYPPTVDWNIPLFQRPQQLALQLSREGYLFFFSSGSKEYDHVEGFQKIEDRCYITNCYDLLIKELPEFILLFSSTNMAITLNGIQSLMSKAFIIYEYIDEISEDISGTSIENIIRRHQYLIKSADVVIATADKLFDDVTKIRQNDVYLNPNGVDYEHFHITRNPENIPSDLRPIIKKGNPIIGYYGALATWFDYKLIIELAEKRPNYEIVLVGWDYDRSMKDHRLDHYDNIHYLGVKKYPVLPEYAIWFDVSIIPFVLNEVTESTSPIKIFEYMALGTPIVTTDMRECRKYSSVLIGKDYEDFIKKIDEGLKLKKDKPYLALLDKEAKENTWKNRAQQIDEIISLSRK
ncbi:MAG: methyltransferase domain-containing protein [Euryarchaeota archaeon]|nr:methyltransferase domain-containing protein [Euryarchaeota archaeon]